MHVIRNLASMVLLAGAVGTSAAGQTGATAPREPSAQRAGEVAQPAEPQAKEAAVQPKAESAAGDKPAVAGSEEAVPAEAAVKKSEPAYDIWTTKELTGNWGGVRTDLKDAGIELQLTSQTQLMSNMKGGLETTNGHDFGGSYDLTLLLDFEKMKWIEGANFFFRAKGTYGGEVNDFDRAKIGGLFRTNGDAAAEEPIYVDKWWWRQRLRDDRIELRLGRLVSVKDLFDENAIAGTEDTQFMNSALFANPTIPHRSGLGVYANVWPVEWLYLRAAAIDNDARPTRTGFDSAFHDDDLFVGYAEVGLAPKWKTSKGALTGHYRFGTWYDPRSKEEFRNTLGGSLATQVDTGDYGFYFGSDQMLWKEKGDPTDDQGLSGFLRYGYAHEDVNRIEHFWSTGAQYRGAIPGRDRDTIGLGVAQAILSDDYQRELRPLADAETVYELYYAYEVARWVVLTPDFQYIVNPGGDSDDRDAFVFGLRLRAQF